MSEREGLPDGWAAVPLSNACHIEMGQSPPSSTYNNTGEGLPFLQGKAEFGELYPRPVKWCSKPGKIARKDDVLLSVRAPVGPSNLAPSECCIGRGLAALSPPPGIETRYLLYWMRHASAQLREMAAGSTFEAVTATVVKSFPIRIAPTNEQRRIVAKIEELFSDLDAGVAALERAKAKLARYRASVLKAAVEGRLTEAWRAENPNVEPASKLLARILAERRRRWEEEQLARYAEKGKELPKGWQEKYEEPAEPETGVLPTLPEQWCWASVDQLTNVVRGASPRPAGDPKFFRGNDAPWITVGCLTADDEPYLYKVHEYLTAEGRKRSRYVEPDTLLLTNSGATLGVPKITMIGGCINDGSVALLNVAYPLKLFLYYFLSTQTKRLRGINQGAAQPNLNTGIVKAIAVPLPPIAEQAALISMIESRLLIVKKSGDLLGGSLGRAARLRQSILRRAFEGRLVPQDSTDEAAEGLLARIKAEREAAAAMNGKPKRQGKKRMKVKRIAK